MSLSDLIKNGVFQGKGAATVATVATHNKQQIGSVATVASVARGIAKKYEVAAKDETEDLQEHFEERAGLLEYDGGLTRHEAESEAAKITATYARNMSYQWASLRAALSSYTNFLAVLPDKDGPIDSLPLGVAKVAVRYPASKPVHGKRVIRQGDYNNILDTRGVKEPTLSDVLELPPFGGRFTAWDSSLALQLLRAWAYPPLVVDG